MERPVKIAISGKGGVGKTTIAALVCKAFQEKGYRVLAVDADPAMGLASALGFPPTIPLTPLADMKELIAERTGVMPGSPAPFFTLNPHVADLPETLCKEHNGIKLLVMGSVRQGGGGCLCPEGALLRALVQHLLLSHNEAIIMDMEAGLEHLGRSTAQAVDRMLIVVEPGRRSIDTALNIKRLAADIKINRTGLIANKVRNDTDRQFVTAAAEGWEPLAVFPFDATLLQADMMRLPPWQFSPTSLEIARALADMCDVP
ncbi:MAG: carbon monoxide dehydrogenase accessory protein CooC [Desulfobacterota bacterium]|nr:carbon monoxide dehydrogenase accessory protein CooC [Thermodesulfobacteriota bacterium]